MTATNTVPSAEAIEIADYLLGSFLSELNEIEAAVEKAREEPVTVEEYLTLEDEAIKARYDERPWPTREELMPLLVFAVDLEQTTADMVERAAKLRDSVMALMHRADDEELTPARWSEHRAMDRGLACSTSGRGCAVSTAVVRPTREDLIEAVAVMIGHEHAGDAIDRWSEEIQGRLLDCPADNDESWDSDPTVVEVWARAAEIEAEMLESMTRGMAESEIDFGRAATLRAMAPRYRERVTIDIPFSRSEK